MSAANLRSKGHAKPPLIMLPGTLCTERTFQHASQDLADIATVDIRRLAGANSTEVLAANVLENAPERFALCGFSQGSIVALEIMRQAQERVAAVALIACNPSAATREQVEVWAEWKREARVRGVRHIASRLARNVAPGRSDDAPLIETIVGMGLDTPVDDFVGQLDALATRRDAWDVVDAIACASVVVVGDHDPVTPVETHGEIVRRIGHAALHVVEACGHYAPLERPVVVSGILRAWLLDVKVDREAEHA